MGRLGWRSLVAIGAVAVAAGALLAILTDSADDGTQEGADLSVPVEQAPSPRTTSDAPKLPAGTITATSAGGVEVGMSRAEVLERFSAPDERSEVNLGGGAVAPQEDWIWHLPGGEFIVYFDNVSGRVVGFICSTPAFVSDAGAAVGDPFAPIQEAFSARLRLSPIGESSYIFSPREPGSFPALVFNVQEGTIAQIGAGNPPPAGE